jgi:hypothetical protein
MGRPVIAEYDRQTRHALAANQSYLDLLAIGLNCNNGCESPFGEVNGVNSPVGSFELQTTCRDVVAALVGIEPKTPVEAMVSTQMISLHNAVADSLRMARESSEPLRGVHLDHANRLSRTFAALVETFERVRNKGRQTVVVQHVYRGGQAGGAVTK